MSGRTAKVRAEFERQALPHIDALYGTAIRMCRNERDAEDLLQDCLLRAYRFWHRFEQGTNCKAWLFKILTNTFINRYHKRRRESEARFHVEVAALAPRVAVVPWSAPAKAQPPLDFFATSESPRAEAAP